jgi:hypothetical protein
MHAKLKCGDLATAVATEAVQMRDAKITQIYEGRRRSSAP